MTAPYQNGGGQHTQGGPENPDPACDTPESTVGHAGGLKTKIGRLTNLDVDTFISQEIAARYKGGLNDTQRSDWFRAVHKAGDIDLARQIIREIVDDPESTLAVKTFYRKLKASGKGQAQGKFTLQYGTGPFDVFICSVENPRRRYRQSYAVARCYEDGTVVPVPWTVEALIEAFGPVVRRYPEVYGGTWVVDVKEPAQPSPPYRGPNPMADAVKIIKMVPPTPPAPKIPTREELEALGGGRPAPPRKSDKKYSGQSFDPDSDEDLQYNSDPQGEPGERG